MMLLLMLAAGVFSVIALLGDAIGCDWMFNVAASLVLVLVASFLGVGFWAVSQGIATPP